MGWGEVGEGGVCGLADCRVGDFVVDVWLESRVAEDFEKKPERCCYRVGVEPGARISANALQL